MKKLLTLLAVIIMTAVSAWSQTTSTHIVDRGETLASIAKKYGVTEAQIISLNPDAAQYVYVGMELTIPAVAPSAKVGEGHAAADSTTKSALANAPESNNGDEENIFDSPWYEGWTPTGSIGYQFLPRPKYGTNKIAISFYINFGAIYNFNKHFYAGASLGYMYSSSSFHVKEQLTTYSSDYHYITLPIEIGGRLFFNDNYYISPVAGINSLLNVSAKNKIGKKKSDAENYPTYSAIGKLGFRVGGNGCTLGFAYNFPFSKKTYGQSKAYPEVTVSYGF